MFAEENEELVEWLVRCAEDPATRWEGAFELARSAASLRQSCEQADSTQDEDSSEKTEENASEQSVDSDAGQPADAGQLNHSATFAALLSVDQKDRLIKALLSTTELVEGDAELIDAVKDFHDPRLLPFLVSQLRRMIDNPPESTTRVVQVVAEVLHDKRIDALADELPSDDAEDQSAEQDAAARKRSPLLRKFLQQVDRIMRARNLKPAKQ